MKANNKLHDMTVEELNEQLTQYKSELFNLRFQMATSQLDNTARVKQVKKDIARVKTVIRQNELKDSAEA